MNPQENNDDKPRPADIIRPKVEAAYQSLPNHEPDFSDEALDNLAAGQVVPMSKHQQFIYDLMASGRPPRDINAAWHEYYAGLTDDEKHQVWREFNEAHERASKLLRHLPGISRPGRQRRPPSRFEKAAVSAGQRVKSRAAKVIPERQRAPLRSLIFGLTIGLVFILIFMFTFFNERFIAPFIQPSRNLTAARVITAGTVVSTKPEIIIPKINVEIPVVYWVKTIDEKAVQDGLDNGVVHYADTAQPGQDGNVVIVGHSASNIFNKGRYKFAFSLLRKMTNGDNFYLQKGGVRYTYQIYKKTVVKPSDVAILGPDANYRAVATLITCDPPGTNSNRLVVVGKQISPDPDRNKKAANVEAPAEPAILPGNSQSLWSRLVDWFKR